MARQVIVLALIFIALVGAVSAAKDAAAATANATANATAETPTAEAADAAEAPSVGEKGETIGEEANAPTGELGPATAEALGPSGEKSSAGALKVSVAMAGVAAVAGFFSF